MALKCSVSQSIHGDNKCCQQLQYDQKQESTKTDEITPMNHNTWEFAPAVYNPHASCFMKGTRALTSIHLGAAAGAFSAGCCLFIPTFKLGPSQIPRPVWLAPSVVSYRGEFLQLTELNLALTLPLLSVTVRLSLPIQGVVSYSRYDLLALFPLLPYGVRKHLFHKYL